MSDPPNTETTDKPWTRNRGGNPHQLLHAAQQMEAFAKIKRADAQRARDEAEQHDAQALHFDEAASDYRKWAGEQGVTA